MNAEDSLKLARRFIELPLEKRRLFLKALDKEGVDFSLLPIPAGVAVPDRQALSYAQQRMWFLWQLDPQSAAYNLPNAVRLSGPLDRVVLAQAFDWLLERHESLRTVFPERHGVPRQEILSASGVRVGLAIERVSAGSVAEALSLAARSSAKPGCSSRLTPKRAGPSSCNRGRCCGFACWAWASRST